MAVRTEDGYIPESSAAGVISFNGRTGVVVPVAGDYLASEITNDSGVVGADVAAALDTLAASVSGAVTDGANIGAGADVFSSKVGTILEFRSIVGSGRISAAQDPTEVTLSTTAELNDGANVGTSPGLVYRGKTGETLDFKSIGGASGVGVTNGADDITIDGSGLVADGANLGAGAQSFASKVGQDLQFRSIIATSGLTATQNVNDITIDASGLVADGANLGAGTGVFASKLGQNLQFNSLVAGAGIGLALLGGEITITNTDPGGAVTASNIGAGEGVFSAKVGDDLRFRSLTASNGIALVGGATEIDIDGSGLAATASNLGAGAQSFASKVGQDLQFRSLIGSGRISAVQNALDVTFSTTAELNSGANVGTSSGQVYRGKTGEVLDFKRIGGTAGIVVTNGVDDLTVDGSGLLASASSLGAGTPIYDSQVGQDIRFNSLVAGAGISLGLAGGEVTITNTNVGVAESWADTLLVGAVSGGTSPTLSSGDDLLFAAGNSSNIGSTTSKAANVYAVGEVQAYPLGGNGIAMVGNTSTPRIEYLLSGTRAWDVARSSAQSAFQIRRFDGAGALDYFPLNIDEATGAVTWDTNGSNYTVRHTPGSKQLLYTGDVLSLDSGASKAYRGRTGAGVNQGDVLIDGAQVALRYGSGLTTGVSINSATGDVSAAQPGNDLLIAGAPAGLGGSSTAGGAVALGDGTANVAYIANSSAAAISEYAHYEAGARVAAWRWDASNNRYEVTTQGTQSYNLTSQAWYPTATGRDLGLTGAGNRFSVGYFDRRVDVESPFEAIRLNQPSPPSDLAIDWRLGGTLRGRQRMVGANGNIRFEAYNSSGVLLYNWLNLNQAADRVETGTDLYVKESTAASDTTLRIYAGGTSVARLEYADGAGVDGFINYNHADRTLRVGSQGTETFLVTPAEIRPVAATAGVTTLGSFSLRWGEVNVEDIVRIGQGLGAPVLLIDKAAASSARIDWQDAGVTRYREIFATNEHLQFVRYNSSGVFQGTTLELNQAGDILVDSRGFFGDEIYVAGATSGATWSGSVAAAMGDGTGSTYIEQRVDATGLGGLRVGTGAGAPVAGRCEYDIAQARWEIYANGVLSTIIQPTLLGVGSNNTVDIGNALFAHKDIYLNQAIKFTGTTGQVSVNAVDTWQFGSTFFAPNLNNDQQFGTASRGITRTYYASSATPTTPSVAEAATFVDNADDFLKTIYASGNIRRLDVGNSYTSYVTLTDAGVELAVGWNKHAGDTLVGSTIGSATDSERVKANLVAPFDCVVYVLLQAVAADSGWGNVDCDLYVDEDYASGAVATDTASFGAGTSTAQEFDLSSYTLSKGEPFGITLTPTTSGSIGKVTMILEAV